MFYREIIEECLYCRFKSEVSKALEQFEEKEDVFIKQVKTFYRFFVVNG